MGHLGLQLPIDMATEATGRVYEHSAGKLIVYLPVSVSRDSAFPFRAGEQVRVRLDASHKRLLIEKK